MTIKVRSASGKKFANGFKNIVEFNPDKKQYLTDKALVELHRKIGEYMQHMGIKASHDNNCGLGDVSLDEHSETEVCETCILFTTCKHRIHDDLIWCDQYKKQTES